MHLYIIRYSILNTSVIDLQKEKNEKSLLSSLPCFVNFELKIKKKIEFSI